MKYYVVCTHVFFQNFYHKNFFTLSYLRNTTFSVAHCNYVERGFVALEKV